MHSLILPVFTLALITGIALDCMGFPMMVWALAGAAFCVVAAVTAERIMLNPKTRSSAFLMSIALIGAACGGAASYRLDRMAPYSIALHAGESVALEATVVKTCSVASGSRVTLDDLRISGSPMVCGKLELDVAVEPEVVPEGSRIFAQAVLRPTPVPMNPGEPDWRVHMLCKGVHATGTASPSQFSVVGRVSLGPVGGCASWLRRLLRRSTAVLPSRQESLMNALVMGDSSQLDTYTQQIFSRAGISHLVAASGLHLGIVCSFVKSAAECAGSTKRVASAMGILGAALYAVAVGMRASVVRALIVLCVVNASSTLGRRVQPLNLICIAAGLQLLSQPVLIWHIGFRLSYAAFAALMFAPKPRKRVLASAPGSLLLTSLAVCTVTWPITAEISGEVSLVGPVMNLIAVPLASFALFGGLLAAFVCPVLPAVGECIMRGAGVLLECMVRCAEFGASLPLAFVFAKKPSFLFKLLYYSFLVVAARAAGDALFVGRLRRIARRNVAALTVCTIAAMGIIAIPPPFQLTALCVGQGDSTLIRTPGGACVLVDTGTSYAGAKHVAPFLARQGVRRIDLLVITHEHADHAGGLEAVVEVARVNAIAVGKGMPEAQVGRLLDETSFGTRVPQLLVVERGHRIRVADLELRVMNPGPSSGMDPNARSVVLHLECRGFAALLCADAGSNFEKWACSQNHIRAHMLRVAHHGSATSSSSMFLSAVSPRWAVISVGPNRYGHPASCTLERLESEGIGVIRTDTSGAAEFRRAWGQRATRVYTHIKPKGGLPLFRSVGRCTN